MAAWGDAYIDLLLRFVLPNQLSSGNLPAFFSRFDSTLKIYTKKAHEKVLRDSAPVPEISKIGRVEIEFVDDVDLDSFKIKSDNINLMIESHKRAIESSFENERETGLIFLAPDVLFSEGSFGKLADIISMGKRAVVMIGLRVAQEAVLPVFEKKLAEGGPAALAFPPRELVKLTVDNLHHFETACFWNSPNFNKTWPNHLIWKAPDGLLVRNFHMHPLFMLPRIKKLPIRTVDFNYMCHVFRNYDDFHIVDDSDDIMCLSLTSREHFKGTSYHEFEPHQATVVDVSYWANHYTDWLHQTFVRRNLRFHEKEITDDWKEVEREADMVLGAALAMSNPARKPSNIENLGENNGQIGGAPDLSGMNTEDDSFIDVLQMANTMLSEAQKTGQISMEECFSLISMYEKLGIYNWASKLLATFFANSDIPAVATKKKFLEKKDEKREEMFKSNFENGLAALEKYFPESAEAVKNADTSTIVMAGDQRKGFQIITRKSEEAFDGTVFQKVTFSNFEVMSLIESMRQDLKSLAIYGSLALSDSSYFVLLPWLGSVCDELPLSQRFKIFFLEPDAALFAACMRTMDISSMVESGMLAPFVGPRHLGLLYEWFRKNPYAPMLNDSRISSDELFSKAIEVFDMISKEIMDLAFELRSRIDRFYSSLTPGELRKRFSSGRLNILMLISKKHPVLREIGKNVEKFFSGMGHSTLIETEPDLYSNRNLLAMLNCMNKYNPDVVIDFNHFRYEFKPAFPEAVPYVSIVSDEVEPGAGEEDKYGRMDFIFTPSPEKFAKAGPAGENVVAIPEIPGNNVSPQEYMDYSRELSFQIIEDLMKRFLV